MKIISEVVHWIYLNADTIHQIHDHVVDGLIKYCKLYVAYSAVKKEKKRKKPTVTPDQEGSVDSSQTTDNEK